MLREETVVGPGYSFVCSNKISCSRTKTSPDGIGYMTDAEFEAHKMEQQAAMERSLQEQSLELARRARLTKLYAELKNGTLNQHEVLEMLRLERGL